MKFFSKSVLVLMLLVAIAVLVFGPRAESDVPDGRVRVQYWEKWTGNEGEQMRQIVSDFNETVGKEKGIWVEYVSMSQINQKTLVATAAGVPPDIAGVWEAQVVQYAAMDSLEPLDELAAEYGLTREHYKPVYYDSCTYRGTLFALPSTPAATALHYNKRLVQAKADQLRAAGFDPDVPPRTLAELDAWATILDEIEESGGRKRVIRTGYLPMEPGWFIQHTPRWFGGSIYDEATNRVNFLSPESIAAYDWVRSYSEKLGRDSMTEFRSGLGGFNSTQNPFLTGDVVMVKQGPWMANYIENLKPTMNRWNVPEAELKREDSFKQVREGMPLAEALELMGPADSATPEADGRTRHTWKAALANVFIVAKDARVVETGSRLLPVAERRERSEWAAAPFPAAKPGLENVAFAGMDVLVIPRGAKHKREAFEFLAYVSSQAPMEKLCSMHSKNSPLAQVSQEFIDNHPNPYIAVFDQLAASELAFGVPSSPVYPEINDELQNAVQRIYLLEASTEAALREAQERATMKLERFTARQQQRQAMRGDESR